MLEIEALISSSLPFWDDVAIAASVIAGLAALLAISIDIAGLFDSEELKTKLRYVCAVLVVASATGQIVATSRITAVTGRIVAYLNDRAQLANKAAAEANERAGLADERAGAANERAAGANERAGAANQLAAEANERAGQAHERAASLELAAAKEKKENLEREKKVAELRSLVDVRDLSENQRTVFANSIEGRRRQITLILPDDQEARAFGDEKFAALLRRSGFVVKIDDLGGTSKHSGIIVCDNGGGEVNLSNALKKAKIQNRLFRPNMKDRPEFCYSGFGEPTMRVFVGQRAAPLGRP